MIVRKVYFDSQVDLDACIAALSSRIAAIDSTAACIRRKRSWRDSEKEMVLGTLIKQRARIVALVSSLQHPI